jgi:hypothetical protein
MSAMSGMGQGTLDLVSDALRNHFGALKVQKYGPSPYTDSHYLAFDTTAWREMVGNPDTSSEDYLADYRAYLEGDVWYYTVEKWFAWHKVYVDASMKDSNTYSGEWKDVDADIRTTVYGSDAAKAEAGEAFTAYLKEVGASPFRADYHDAPEVPAPAEASWGDINRLHLANNLAAVYGRNYKDGNARWAVVADEAIRLIQSTD